MENNRSNFLKQIREQKGLSQEELAELADVTRSIISEFETGKRRPSPRTINKIATALECSYIFLLTGKDDKNEKKKERAALNRNRQNYLLQAVALTKECYSAEGFSDELMMKISGQLSYFIEEYKEASAQDRARVLEEIEEADFKGLAAKIFLKAKHDNSL